MNIRAPETKRGRYDDLIAWLKQLQNKFEVWLEYRKAHGIFDCLLLLEFYERVANPIAATVWEKVHASNKERTLHWIHIVEAREDISHEMEGWTRIQPDQLRDHIENIRAAIRWFEQNNVQEDFGIKY